MGIRHLSQVMDHPLGGALFENWDIMELMQGQCNAGLKPGVFFLRDKQGRELDALIKTGSDKLMGIEIKSGAYRGQRFYQSAGQLV